jgi:plastocyanin
MRAATATKAAVAMRGRRTSATRVAVVLVALAVLAGACGGDDDGGTDDPYGEIVDLREQVSGAYPEVRVAVKDNEFIPRAIRINPGTTVEWVNEGRSDHNILRIEDLDGFGVETDDFAPGDSYEFRFDQPGVYRYWCSLHGTETRGMVGMVVVGDVTVGDLGTTAPDEGTTEGTLRVPEEYPTIQAAVDDAAPGSLVLVAPGVYREAVVVTTRDLVIRGLDRDETILDGEFELDNGFKVLADGVAIENMTARNYTLNGFFWTGVTGYRGSYLTAFRNGDYGIYAFDAVKGQFDHSYASGSPDAGFYIGQCFPCDAVITDVVAEWNGLGYSGTNAGGNLLIVSSVWRHNRAGIVPNSGTGEANPPERQTTIVGNEVYANNNEQTAAIEIASVATGNGILLAGGHENVVERNLVYDHDITGIAVIPLPEKLLDPDNPVAENFDARGNVVKNNVLRDNRAADLALVTSIDDPTDAGDNCFSGNDHATSLPADVERVAPCDDSERPPFMTDLGRFVELLGSPKPEGADYRTVDLPDPTGQPQMPDAATAPGRPASRGTPMAVDLASITTPDATVRREQALRE